MLEVEIERKRIALTMRMDEQPQPKGAATSRDKAASAKAGGSHKPAARQQDAGNAAMGNAFAAALAKLKK